MESTQGPKAIPGILGELKKIHPPDKLSAAIAMLAKLLENIVASPLEVKYRGIKRTNQILEGQLFRWKGIERVLFALGFREDGEFYRYTIQDVVPLSQAVILLRAAELSVLVNDNQDDASRQRSAQVKSEHEKKQEEKERLRKEIEGDRKAKREFLQDHPAQGSKANQLKFGSKIVTRKDMDPNCDNPKGG